MIHVHRNSTHLTFYFSSDRNFQLFQLIFHCILRIQLTIALFGNVLHFRYYSLVFWSSMSIWDTHERRAPGPVVHFFDVRITYGSPCYLVSDVIHTWELIHIVTCFVTSYTRGINPPCDLVCDVIYPWVKSWDLPLSVLGPHLRLILLTLFILQVQVHRWAGQLNQRVKHSHILFLWPPRVNTDSDRQCRIQIPPHLSMLPEWGEYGVDKVANSETIWEPLVLADKLKRWHPKQGFARSTSTAREKIKIHWNRPLDCNWNRQHRLRKNIY